MGLLDDAIREHLELKKRHGADPTEIADLEREAFGPARRAPEPLEVPDAAAPAEEVVPPEVPVESEAVPEPSVEPALEEPPLPAQSAPQPVAEPEPVVERAPEPEPEPDPVAEDLAWEDAAPERDEPKAPEAEEPQGEDLLEETPEFLEETPEHDRLWFEQRPPRDFDFDG
jgi:hypothetical protein